MRHTTDTLPDRGADISHMIRSQETWHGVLVREPDTTRLAKMKEGLDEILRRCGHHLSLVEDGDLYCKGAYSPETLAAIRQYLSGANNPKPIILRGSYEDLSGDYWLEQARSEYKG